MPTEQMQRDGYLGNHTRLLDHMTELGTNTMSTTAVQDWFKDHPAFFPQSYVDKGYDLAACQIDHILPWSVGGADHPFNYYILPIEINQQWNGWWTCEKRAYMGLQNFEKFSHFIHWTRKEAERKGLQYNDFRCAVKPADSAV